MYIAVIGCTGMTGRAVTQELLTRGHRVTGIARKLTDNIHNVATFCPVPVDIFDVVQLTKVISEHDAVVSTFSGGHEIDLSVYYRQVEGTRRILSSVGRAKIDYFLYVGGAASLLVGPDLEMLDDPRFPSWYFGIQPAEHLRWLAEITGVEVFNEAADRRERGIVEAGKVDPQLAAAVKEWRRIPLLDGCRAALDLFHKDLPFRWSFLSPPWLYRPGPLTGLYELNTDYMIFRDGIPAGISVPDLAIAIADEVENQRLVHTHWTACGNQSATGGTPPSALNPTLQGCSTLTAARCMRG